MCREDNSVVVNSRNTNLPMPRLIDIQNRDWNALLQSDPPDVSDLVAYATLGGVVGTKTYSTTFNSAPLWSASPFGISGVPTCSANGADNLQNVMDASIWNFNHLTSNLAPSLAIPLRTMIYLRAGVYWTMRVDINLGANNYVEFQLGYLDAAATLGNKNGQIPVILFNTAGSPLTGIVSLNVTTRRPGAFLIGLRAVDNNSTPIYSMFDMLWKVVP